jgi:hypothetical protein
MRLIGIDPGLRRTGFGVIEIISRQKAVYLGSGVIRPPTDRPEPERLGLLYAGMQSVLSQYEPSILDPPCRSGRHAAWQLPHSPPQACRSQSSLP